TAFQPAVRVHDPWLPPAVLREAGALPSSLDDLLRTSRFVFMLATATGESEHLLSDRTLGLMPDGARLVLVSRAPVTDYDALLDHLRRGRIQAAVDVWPDEPLPAGSPFRALENVIVSGHRA